MLTPIRERSFPEYTFQRVNFSHDFNEPRNEDQEAIDNAIRFHRDNGHEYVYQREEDVLLKVGKRGDMYTIVDATDDISTLLNRYEYKDANGEVIAYELGSLFSKGPAGFNLGPKITAGALCDFSNVAGVMREDNPIPVISSVFPDAVVPQNILLDLGYEPIDVPDWFIEARDRTLLERSEEDRPLSTLQYFRWNPRHISRSFNLLNTFEVNEGLIIGKKGGGIILNTQTWRKQLDVASKIARLAA